MSDALFASLSTPGFFPPADVMGGHFFDGSAVRDIDIFTAVNRCSELGYKNEDIVVDVLLTSTANLKPVEAEAYKGAGMLFRYLEIAAFYNAMDGLLRAKFAYDDVNFRCVISPSQAIEGSTKPFGMDAEKVQAAYDMGAKDANDAIERGCEETLDHLIHFYALK